MRTLLFFCPAVREEVAVCFRWSAVGHGSGLVEDVCEVVEEVDIVEPARTCEGVEDASSLGAGMAAEEEGVASYIFRSIPTQSEAA